jgi:hypothetical protein
MRESMEQSIHVNFPDIACLDIWDDRTEDFSAQVLASYDVVFLGGGHGQVLNISNERCTFLEAMAMLGDNVSLHTRRDHIAVMREINGRMVVRYLDPRSSDVFNDPFFMLQQNDFIIADTYDNSVVRSEVTYWLGIGSAIVSAFSLVVSLIVLKKVN